MLWLSIHLPHLALEVFPREALDGPWAVTDGPAQRPLIHARNRAAAAAGVIPGMPLALARSLCPTLLCRNHDTAAEQQALAALALWAQQFTPLVHLQPPDGLLLEIAGSLHLFGGLAALRQRIAADLAALGYHPRLAVAPTPRGSWLLARSRRELMLTELPPLRRALEQLPVAALEPDAGTLQALHDLGKRRIGDLLALPRDGAARRFDPALLRRLDQALGRLPDPRRPFAVPETFASRLPLPAEVEESPALLFAARRLVLELVGYLRARHAGSMELKLTLEHRQRPPSRLPVGLVQPSRDADHLLLLLKERLERFVLPAPTDAITLESRRLLPLESDHGDLFATAVHAALTPAALVERLRARLGHEGVSGLQTTADHRPERAAKTVGFAMKNRPTDAGNTTLPRRPLWLLPEPLSLATAAADALLHEPLQFDEGPERIESGWWNGDAVRDYFIATDARGERLWVYRERPGNGWYLHGLFG